MSFQEIRILFDNGLVKTPVGVLAATNGRMLFEYYSAWISGGVELSPFHLPLAERTYRFESGRLPDRLPGLCADSLPDGWGMLIMDRHFMRQGIARNDISPFDRLAWLGDEAMGALCYQPSLRSTEALHEAVQIGVTAREALQLFEGRIEDAGQLLARIGGSPGGARPKALIGCAPDGVSFVSGAGSVPEGYSHWLVKFSASRKSITSGYGRYEGTLEHICLAMAAAAGIRVPENRLIDDGNGVRHIAVRRFDRPSPSARLHVATASGLLHADHRLPSLDYADLLKLAWSLTNDMRHVQEQYRRAVFNLFVGNRDDHAKNHGYLLDGKGGWGLSPVYDVTFVGGPGGEHCTAYLGEGREPDISLLLKLAEQASIKAADARLIIGQVQSAVATFSALAKEQGIPSGLRRQVEKQLNQIGSSVCGNKY